MAVFGAAKGSGNVSGHQRIGGREPNVSIVAAGMRITGTLETEGFLRVEGKVEGDLRAAGQVLVSPGGLVEGDIHSRQAIVAGEVRGQIIAGESVDLKSGCMVVGDITTPRITVEEGGAVNGQLKMSGKKHPTPMAVVEPAANRVPEAVRSNDTPEFGRLRSVG